MIPEKYNDLFDSAKDFFEENQYSQAESILNQMILKNIKDPMIFHMLGTIYYDQGKFNKAIRSFRRAIEIEPSFTDASVGLSIILNDLGRYEEGRKVFEEARTMLDHKNKGSDPYMNEKISIKHDELGELYFQYGRFEEALEQFARAKTLSGRVAEISMKIVECHIKADNYNKAVKTLTELLREHHDFHPARIKLGKIYYDSHQVPEAVSQWEIVLRKEPENKQALSYLKLAQSVDVITVREPTNHQANEVY